MADLNPLRRRMIEDMTVRDLSPATQQSYLHAVSKFSRLFGGQGHDPGTPSRDGDHCLGQVWHHHPAGLSRPNPAARLARTP